jgi:hypothetical protein
MSASDWTWVLAVGGTVASLAGVVFSWLAWIQAGKAKEAAEDASSAVRKRNAANEVMRLAGDAKEFLSAIQQRRLENAISTANGLVHGLAIVRSRSIADMPDARVIKSCENEIMRVIVGLQVDGLSPDQASFQDLLGRCHGIHQSVCELAGRLESRAEGVAQ